jgi:DNA-binding GntR family transcriptional regulator
MLLEALEQLDGELASEAIVADLRDVCEQAHLELERQAGLAGA